MVKMTTTKSSFLFKHFFLIVSFLFSVHLLVAEDSSSQSKFVIAAQKFSFVQGQPDNAVNQGTSITIPTGIMEKLDRYIKRNVLPDERFERTKYQLRTERQSLYLQLSAEYKKRDAIVLKDFSEKKLKATLKEENKKILEIKNKIADNLEKLKAAEQEAQNEMELLSTLEAGTQKEESEMQKISKFVKRIFKNDESVVTIENISFYGQDYSSFFSPSENAQELGYLSSKMEKEVCNAKINTLITGSITSYEDYLSVSVEVYLYPGARKICSVMEVGSLDDLEMISSSLANQIIPMLTNALPVQLFFEMPEDVPSSALTVYVDDVIQNLENKKIVLQSGVHNIQFVAEGYRTAGTSYYFDGNTNYKIQVNLVKESEGFMQIGIVKPLFGELFAGDIFANGEKSIKEDEKRSRIKINGNSILGEFITENEGTDFFYIPENLVENGNFVIIKPKPRDREQYIDTRRKWMYGSWSALMVSLIPFFYTYGNLKNNADKYQSGFIAYDQAVKWKKAYKACSVVSIACGVFWGYELVRYFIAANSVLPQKARATDLNEYLIENTMQNALEAANPAEAKPDTVDEAVVVEEADSANETNVTEKTQASDAAGGIIE